MGRRPSHIKTEVGNSSKNGQRTFVVTLSAPLSMFELPDLLVERSVINPLDNELRQAVQEAVRRYIKSADNLVNALAKSRRRTVKNQTNNDDNDQITRIPVRRFQ